jgi:hypothetical protein
MMWILQDEIQEYAGIFIENSGIKRPRTTYGGEVLTENPGIRHFLWEYAITLEHILFRVEEAQITVLGKNLAYYVPALDIVGHLVFQTGWRVSKQKCNKIDINMANTV